MRLLASLLLLALPLQGQAPNGPPQGDYYVTISVMGMPQCVLLFPKPYCKAVRPAYAKVTNHTADWAVITSEWLSGQANYLQMPDLDPAANGSMAAHADKIGFRATLGRFFNSPYFNFGLTALATAAGGPVAGLATTGGITAIGQLGDAVSARRTSVPENVAAMSGEGVLKLEPGGSGALYLWIMATKGQDDPYMGEPLWIDADEEKAPIVAEPEKTGFRIDYSFPAPPRAGRCQTRDDWLADTMCGNDVWTEVVLR